MWSPRFENTPNSASKPEENPITLDDGVDAVDQQPLEQHANPLLPADATTPPVTKAPRLLSLDLMRGSIMVVMAWDHCKDIISDGKLPKNRGFEAWGGPMATFDDNFGLFFARWVSHFCAPGFFWSMGVAMTLVTWSRMERSGWSAWDIRKHYLVRGGVLLLMDRIVDPPFILGSIVDQAEVVHCP